LTNIAPVLSNGWTLLGETDKYVSVSNQRFDSINVSGSELTIDLIGDNQEKVTVALLNADGKYSEYECKFNNVSKMILTLPAGSCNWSLYI